MSASGQLLRDWSINPRRTIAPIAALSAVGTLLESAAITVVIAMVTARLSGDASVSAFGADIRPSYLGALALAALAASFTLQMLVSARVAGLSGDFVTAARRRLVRSFGAADGRSQQQMGTARLHDLGGSVAYQASLFPMRVATAVASLAAAAVLGIAAAVAHPAVTAVMVVSGAAIGWLMRKVGRRSGRLAAAHLRSQQRYTSGLAEWADLQRDIRAMGVESTARGQVESAVDTVGTDLTRLRSALEATGIAYRTTAIAWLLVLTVVANIIDVPRPARALAALALLVRAISYVQQAVAAMQVASEARPPCAELLAACEELERCQRPTPTASLAEVESITATDVAYRPPGAERAVLDPFDLHIRRGAARGDRRLDRQRQEHAGGTAAGNARPDRRCRAVER